MLQRTVESACHKVASPISPGAAAATSYLRLSYWILPIALVSIYAPAAIQAADPFAEHLAAGEFAPAMEMARTSNSAQLRDRRLAQIAAAQATAGMSQAAMYSAGEIADDRLRTDTLTSRYSAGGAGGAVEPDFESLIELITSTIAPTTWDTVGGPGAIDEFAGGVYVDAQGALAPLVQDDHSGRLTGLRLTVSPEDENDFSELQGVHRPSQLRLVSLPRLEKAVQLRQLSGQPLDESMLYLAGLQRIKYVFVYPETGDLVIAGPAEPWKEMDEGKVVGRISKAPVLRLEDLAVVLRHMLSAEDARFGCSITPTQENLARTKAFLKQSSQTSLAIGKRDAWLEALRSQLGPQEIDVYGLDPGTRAARVLVEADYRMKLVGMGLEEGVLGVESYLSQIQVQPGQAPPPMDVLRWWFTLNYRAVLATADRQAFEIRGQGVKVLSENELLTAQGKRVHTGKSDELNSQFALSFTQKFPQLAVKYPIYAELRNLCDLALVSALIRSEHLGEKTNWHATWFGDTQGYPVSLASAPKTVETVINHRVINRRHIVAGVSGGVRIDPQALVQREALETDSYGLLPAERKAAAVPTDLGRDDWWWDQRN